MSNVSLKAQIAAVAINPADPDKVTVQLDLTEGADGYLVIHVDRSRAAEFVTGSAWEITANDASGVSVAPSVPQPESVEQAPEQVVPQPAEAAPVDAAPADAAPAAPVAEAPVEGQPVAPEVAPAPEAPQG